MNKYVKEIKLYIKKIIGLRNIILIKTIWRYLRNLPGIFYKEKIHVGTCIGRITELSQKGMNVFCGYYDVPIFDEKDESVLVHVVRKNAVPGCDIALIGTYNIEKREFHKVTETYAWNWQQGSRLRWSTVDSDCILVNQYEGGKYFCAKINAYTGKEICRFCDALYDITYDEKYGVTCDFPRLQRLRSGYGYSNTLDDSIHENAPADKGLYLVDLVENKKRLIISLEKLAKLNDENYVEQHYVNAILFSPNGKRIMFFHIYNIHEPTIFRWKTQLCVYDIEEEKLEILEDKANVSHYTWLNDQKLLITGITLPDSKPFYRIYDCEELTYEEYTDSILKEDGHPAKCISADWMITDTYPDQNQYQHLIKYDMKLKHGSIIASLYSFPRISEEIRCDLHPKLSRSGKMVAVDSICKNWRREVVILQLK